MSQAITSKRGQVDGLRWPPELPKGFLPSNASSGYRPARTVAVRGDGEFDSITWLEGSERRTSTGVATFLHGIHPEIRLNRRARRSARAAKLTRSAEPAMPPRVAAAPHRAKRRPPRNWLRPGQQQPEFSALPSKLTFGPPTDISMGWDGTLWAIDQSGAAHLYDPTEQQWQLQGQGISAAAVVPDNSEYHATLYLFRGSEFVTVAPGGTYQTSTPKTIAEQWPHLPDTFKMGVVGATWGGYVVPGEGERQSLFLFGGGRYISIDEDFGSPLKLTDLTNWPQTLNWKDGVIDGVFARVVDSPLFLLRNGELIEVNLLGKAVLGPPQAFKPVFLLL